VLVCAGIISLCLVTCIQPIKGKNGLVYKSAIQYNDYIIDRQATVVKKMFDLKEVAETNLDSAGKMLDETISQLEGMIDDIKGMPAYKGDSLFRDAAIGSFAFYKKIFRNEYRKIINIRQNGGDTTEAGMMEIKEIVDQISREEEKYDKAFHNSQKDFADNNHMKLEKNEMQKKIKNRLK
jgi:hypothetical protein